MSPVTFIKRPVFWLETISAEAATHVQSPNFGYTLSARKYKAMKEPPQLDLSSLRHMFNAAEPVTGAAIDHFVGTFAAHGLRAEAMVPGYGLAEHTVYVTGGGGSRLQIDRDALLGRREVT